MNKKKSSFGRKFKNKKLEKLKKPISFFNFSNLCNNVLLEKNKIRLLTQIFRWYRKNNKYYKVRFFLKKKKYISNLDYINLTVKIQKAGLKKLLLKLNYHLIDYKILKRRIYSLNFLFFFIDIENKKNKDITLDVNLNKNDIINIFVTTGSYYFDEFYYILNTWLLYKKEKKDKYDLIFDTFEYVYCFTRNYKIICYELYIPSYLSKEDYYEFFKNKSEKKYKAFMSEKKIDRMFPLKNVKGSFFIKDENNINSLDVFGSLIQLNTFKKKEDFFKHLKFLIKNFKWKYKHINPMPIYFYIENIIE